MEELAAEALNAVDLQSSVEKSQAKRMQGVVGPLTEIPWTCTD